MLSIILDDLYIRKFKKKINNIFIDGANPSFIRALKIEIGENEEYEPLVERARKMKSDVSNYMQVIHINNNKITLNKNHLTNWLKHYPNSLTSNLCYPKLPIISSKWRSSTIFMSCYMFELWEKVIHLNGNYLQLKV